MRQDTEFDHDRRDEHTDDCFEILGQWQRRFLLRYLEHHSTPVTVRQLARAMAAERETIGVKGMRVRLHNVDLPKLDAAGLVRYNAATERVTGTTGTTDDVTRPVADAVGELERIGGHDR